VTPRKWRDREKWCIKKSRTKKWKDIRVLDCSDLAEWLDSTPAVAFWVARLIGKRPANVWDLSAHWDNIRNLSEPKLRPEVFFGGRELEIRTVEGWLKRENAPLYVEADSPDEVIDFFAAFALSQRADKRTAEARTVIVETGEAWRVVCASASPLILIPAFEIDPELVTEAVRHNHHILVPTSAGLRPAQNSCKLRRLSAFELENSLAKSRFDARRAKRVARESGGSSLVLKRLIVSGAPKLPRWASPSVASKLAPFLLIGSWNDDNDSGPDREVVTQITGLNETEVQALVQQWSRGGDPLFRRKDRTWRLVSRADSWRWLASYLSQQTADAFAVQFREVVAVDDPRFELKPEERIMASVLGKKLKHSPAIRNGMIEAFALLAVSSDESADIQPTQVSIALWKLFGAVFPPGIGWQRWASLGENLMLLAEAMPEDFLAVLEREINPTPSTLVGLFGQEHFLSGSPATGLMWALEILGWNPNYLLPVTLSLAKLCRLDPGGNWSPRPFGVLSDFFHPLFPQTTSTSQRRFEVLEELTKQAPDIAWKLLLAILPKGGGISLYNSQPRWRNWSEGWDRGVRNQNAVAGELELIADRIVALAAGQPHRLIELFNHFAHFKAAARNRLFDSIRNLDTSQLDESGKEKLASALRGFISDTRRAQNAWWAMPKNVIDELEEVLGRICPADLVLKHRWLFDRWPQLPGFSYDVEQKQRDAAVAKARAAGLAEIAQAGGLPFVLRLAEESTASWVVGVTAANAKLVDDSILPALLVSPKSKLMEFARGYAAARFGSEHWGWIDSLPVSGWTAEQMASLALALPFEPRVWEFVTAHSQAASNAYWSQCWGYNNALTLADCERALRRWLDFKRAGPAIALLSLILDQQKPDPLLVIESLEMLTTVQNQQELQQEVAQSAFRISQLFEYLHKSPGLEASRIMVAEWNYLPLLHHSRTRPKQLFAALAEQPPFFVQILGMIYRREDERGADRKEPTEAKTNLGERARRLLDEWKSLPGTEADGCINEQTLRNWVEGVREAAKAQKYEDVACYRIGELLAHAPAEADGIWPCVPVRRIIEDWKREELESGIRCERFNEYQPSSGLKPIPERSWRELADKHRKHAEALAGRWLRTAAVLRELAESYEGSARRRESHLTYED
jgi:hypothetical protein